MRSCRREGAVCGALAVCSAATVSLYSAPAGVMVALPLAAAAALPRRSREGTLALLCAAGGAGGRPRAPRRAHRGRASARCTRAAMRAGLRWIGASTGGSSGSANLGEGRAVVVEQPGADLARDLEAGVAGAAVVEQPGSSEDDEPEPGAAWGAADSLTASMISEIARDPDQPAEGWVLLDAAREMLAQDRAAAEAAIRVKLRDGSTVRRFSAGSWPQLVERARASLGPRGGAFSLLYEDEEGDLVTMTGDADFAHARSVRGGRGALNVHVRQWAVPIVV